jgi:hypothetical protein
MLLLGANDPGWVARYLLFTAITSLVLGLNLWAYRRAIKNIERWAATNRLRVLERRFGWFLTGSFPWVANRGTLTYKITVEDADGNVRRGRLLVKGFFYSKVEPRWDADSEPTTAFPVQPLPAAMTPTGRSHDNPER